MKNHRIFNLRQTLEGPKMPKIIISTDLRIQAHFSPKLPSDFFRQIIN